MQNNRNGNENEKATGFYYRIQGSHFYGIFYGSAFEIWDNYSGPFPSYAAAKDAAIEEMSQIKTALEISIRSLEYSIRLLEQLGPETARKL